MNNTYKIIDGKHVASVIKNGLTETVEALKQKGIDTCLAVILVGEDPASKVYVANKRKDCDELGIRSLEYKLPATTTMEELLTLIEQLNKDDSVHGILCQLPLPRGLDERKVIDAIDPSKDVDAFHPYNVGNIMIGQYSFLPCTPAGVMELLEYYNIDVAGKTCVVIGRSNIVGKPMSMLLLQKNGTVTVCHSRTTDLAAVTRTADILVSAVGKARFVSADMVKEGAVVIDVGMNRYEGKLCGDVCFDEVAEKTSYITPVPGGVGPMTRAVLMQNTVMAAKNKCGE